MMKNDICSSKYLVTSILEYRAFNSKFGTFFRLQILAKIQRGFDFQDSDRHGLATESIVRTQLFNELNNKKIEAKGWKTSHLKWSGLVSRSIIISIKYSTTS